MTLQEMTRLAEPQGFRPFTITTSGGLHYKVPHADFIDIPPAIEGRAASFVTIYEEGPVARFITISQIDSIEFAEDLGR